MESVSTQVALDTLEYVYALAQSRTPVATLLAVLNEKLIQAGETSVEGGGIVVTEQAGNGHDFKGQYVGAYLGTIGLLLRTYRFAVADLGIDGNANPDDEEIKERMELLLAPRTEVVTDRSCLQT